MFVDFELAAEASRATHERRITPYQFTASMLTSPGMLPFTLPPSYSLHFLVHLWYAYAGSHISFPTALSRISGLY